jgi:hypothetical protein
MTRRRTRTRSRIRAPLPPRDHFRRPSRRPSGIPSLRRVRTWAWGRSGRGAEDRERTRFSSVRVLICPTVHALRMGSSIRPDGPEGLIRSCTKSGTSLRTRFASRVDAAAGGHAPRVLSGLVPDVVPLEKPCRGRAGAAVEMAAARGPRPAPNRLEPLPAASHAPGILT